MSSVQRSGIADFTALPKRWSRYIKGLSPSLIIITLTILAAAFIYYLKTWESISAFVASVSHCPILFCDFVKHYYVMGEEIFVSKLPVNGFFYSPFFAILLNIFAQFQLKTAVVVWGVFQALAAILLCVIPSYYFLRESESRIYYYLHILLIAFSVPLLYNLAWGQVSVPLTLFVLLSLYLYRRNHHLAAASLLAIATSIKFYPLIFVMYFIIKKDYRFVSSFVIIVIVFMVLIPAMLLGADESLRFYQVIHEDVKNATWITKNVNSQYFSHVIIRLFKIKSQMINLQIFQAVGYGIFLVNIYLLFIISKLKIKNVLYLAFTLLFLSMPLIIKTSWNHYFAYLPFCQVVVCRAIFQSTVSILLKYLMLVTVILPSAVLSNVVFFNMFSEFNGYSRCGCMFFADFLLLIGMYFLLFNSTEKAWHPWRRQI